MAIQYEWDVEEIHSNGEDVVEHFFQCSYADCQKHIFNNWPSDPEGFFSIVLVKTPSDPDKPRAWCRVALPHDILDGFHDADGKFAGKVPQRFIKEVTREHPDLVK